MAETAPVIPGWQWSQARVLALQALCVFDGLGEALSSEELARFLGDPETYADLGWSQPPAPALLERAGVLATGTWEQRARCDELLLHNARHWPIERLQPVDRSILRLGLYELLECPETPYPIVLNEAVELAKQFGGPESAAFVNGVLDGLRLELEAGPLPEDVGQVIDLPPEDRAGQ